MKLSIKRSLFLLSSLFLILFCSCSNKEKQIHYQRIDHLVNLLDSIELNLLSIDTTQTKANYAIFQHNKKRIREVFADSLKKEYLNILGQYGLVRKPLRNVNATYTRLLKELIYSQQQLKTLRQNIRFDKLDTTKIEAYLKQEAEAIHQLRKKSNLIIRHAKHFGVELFEEVNPRIESLLDSISKTKS